MKLNIELDLNADNEQVSITMTVDGETATYQARRADFRSFAFSVNGYQHPIAYQVADVGRTEPPNVQLLMATREMIAKACDDLRSMLEDETTARVLDQRRTPQVSEILRLRRIGSRIGT